MEQKNVKRDNKILLLILGVATVLVALVGATFAFFTAIVNNVNGNQSVMLTTQTIKGITYEASEPLVLPNAMPGDFATASYVIENPNASADAIYKMELVTDINTFETTDGEGQLILTISGGQLKEDRVFDLTNGENKDKRLIMEEIVLKAGTKDEYTTKIEFVETGNIQDTNKAKSYAGHIEVTEAIITISAD